jgi:uncharacterized membrane protein YagU involved in acid resistance
VADWRNHSDRAVARLGWPTPLYSQNWGFSGHGTHHAKTRTANSLVLPHFINNRGFLWIRVVKVGWCIVVCLWPQIKLVEPGKCVCVCVYECEWVYVGKSQNFFHCP